MERKERRGEGRERRRRWEEGWETARREGKEQEKDRGEDICTRAEREGRKRGEKE